MVLDDHLRRKNRLIPPVIAALKGRFRPYSWAKDLAPELFWISRLVEVLGASRGVEAARQLGAAASMTSGLDPKPIFATFSSFLDLTIDEKEKLRLHISESVLADIRLALAPICTLWPDHPLSFLVIGAEAPSEFQITELGTLLDKLYDKQERITVLSLATVMYLGFNQEKILISTEIFEKRPNLFQEIEDYPNTDESRSAASFFRAMSGLIMMKAEQDDNYKSWKRTFWNGVSVLGKCSGEFQDLPERPDTAEGLTGFIQIYSYLAQKDLRVRQEVWGVELNSAVDRQVVLAIVARQATLAIELISSPGIWNPNIAPIILRSMADLHITLVWILADLENRATLYVNDGLGAIKLEIAHREADALKNPRENSDEYETYTDHLRSWLEYQQYESITEVNLGSWSGKTTRIMASEGDIIDFYNFVFQPFSSAVHSYWSHVGRINAEPCTNPAHNRHLLPVVPQFTPDTHWCKTAAKYYAQTLSEFDKFIDRTDLKIESYAAVIDALEQIKEKS